MTLAFQLLVRNLSLENQFSLVVLWTPVVGSSLRSQIASLEPTKFVNPSQLPNFNPCWTRPQSRAAVILYVFSQQLFQTARWLLLPWVTCSSPCAPPLNRASEQAENPCNCISVVQLCAPRPLPPDRPFSLIYCLGTLWFIVILFQNYSKHQVSSRDTLTLIPSLLEVSGGATAAGDALSGSRVWSQYRPLSEGSWPSQLIKGLSAPVIILCGSLAMVWASAPGRADWSEEVDRHK